MDSNSTQEILPWTEIQLAGKTATEFDQLQTIQSGCIGKYNLLLDFKKHFEIIFYNQDY